MITLSTKTRLCAALILGTAMAVLSAPSDADQPIGRGQDRGSMNRAGGSRHVLNTQHIDVAGSPVQLRLWEQVDVTLSYAEGELLARVRERGTVEVDYRDTDVRITGRVAPTLAGELRAASERRSGRQEGVSP